MSADRDRDAAGRPRQDRPRDALGRPLPYGAVGVEPVSEEPLPPEETLTVAKRQVEQGRPGPYVRHHPLRTARRRHGRTPVVRESPHP